MTITHLKLLAGGGMLVFTMAIGLQTIQENRGSAPAGEEATHAGSVDGPDDVRAVGSGKRSHGSKTNRDLEDKNSSRRTGVIMESSVEDGFAVGQSYFELVEGEIGEVRRGGKVIGEIEVGSIYPDGFVVDPMNGLDLGKVEAGDTIVFGPYREPGTDEDGD